MTACIETTRCRDGYGYGMMRYKGRVRRNHIAVWEEINGPVPKGIFVCHKCDNPSCVNPEHLFLGTPADNSHDRDRKMRLFHKLTPEQVKEIHATYRPYVRGLVQSLADKFGVTQWCIYNVIHRKVWEWL